MRWRHNVGAVAVAAICTVLLTSAAGAAVSPTAATPAELSAVNELLALPWTQIAKDRSEEGEAQIRDALTQVFINKSRGGWGVRSELVPSSAEIVIARPPGFTAIAPTGFAVRAPLAGSWSVGARANLRTTIRIGNQRWRPSVGFGLRVENVRITASAVLDPGDGSRNPELKAGEMRLRFSAAGEGALERLVIPLNTVGFSFDKALGGMTTTRDVSFGVSLGDSWGASFDGQLRLALVPIDFAGFVEQMHPGALLGRARLRGSVSIRLPDPIGRVELGSATYEFKFPVSFGGAEMNGMVRTLAGPQPQQWGEGRQLGRTAPPTAMNLATPLSALEAGMAEHAPYGAVLSIDHRANGPLSPHSYDIEADSALFTGHYLAAESFRYASAPNADALARVKSALAGLDRLFWVTQDAVLVDGRYAPVRQWPGSTFARTALPTNHGITYRKGNLARRGCTYVRPEAGWVATRESGSTIGTYPTYVAATLAAASQTVPTQVTIRPFQDAKGTVRTWHGWGCSVGRENEPVSRDAYSGVLMGLAYAYHLVPDQTVKDEARRLFEEALDFLLAHDWNVVTAPENKVATEFLGQFHSQLAFLRVGATMNAAKYGDEYARFKPASVAAWLPLWFSALDPLSKYFKFNLETAMVGPTLVYETDPVLRANYMNAYMIVRRATAHHRNAYFNLARILVERPENRAAVAGAPSGSNPSLALKDEIKATLGEWIERWDAVKNSNGMPSDAVSDRAASHQALLWPSNVKLFYPLGETEPSYGSAYALPVWARVGNLHYVWQLSPFGTAYARSATCGPPLTERQVRKCEDRGWRESPGVDYLLAYWLARYLGVVGPT